MREVFTNKEHEIMDRLSHLRNQVKESKELYNEFVRRYKVALSSYEVADKEVLEWQMLNHKDCIKKGKLNRRGENLKEKLEKLMEKIYLRKK